MIEKLKDILYGMVIFDFIFTMVYLIRHTDKMGVILIIVFSILLELAISAKLPLEGDDEDGYTGKRKR